MRKNPKCIGIELRDTLFRQPAVHRLPCESLCKAEEVLEIDMSFRTAVEQKLAVSIELFISILKKEQRPGVSSGNQ